MMDASALIDREVVAGIESDGRFSVGEPASPPTLELLEMMRQTVPLVSAENVVVPGVRRDELSVPGIARTPDVPIRIHRQADSASTSAPGIVWMHGGGYVLGSYDMDVPFLDELVARTGCVAVSVEYRLAPETPFPGGLYDCFAVLEWVVERASDIGVDGARVAVGGFSAGAGLAAACAMLARDRGIQLVHQHLIYPMIDDTQTTDSSRWKGLAIWSREMNAFAWRCYLGETYGTDDVSHYAAPARALDLASLPPTYIHVGTLDGFLHEDIDYAARLAAAGVSTECHVFPLVPHAFDELAPAAKVSRAAKALSTAALARVLAPTDGSVETPPVLQND